MILYNIYLNTNDKKQIILGVNDEQIAEMFKNIELGKDSMFIDGRPILIQFDTIKIFDVSKAFNSSDKGGLKDEYEKMSRILGEKGMPILRDMGFDVTHKFTLPAPVSKKINKQFNPSGIKVIPHNPSKALYGNLNIRDSLNLQKILNELDLDDPDLIYFEEIMNEAQFMHINAFRLRQYPEYRFYISKTEETGLFNVQCNPIGIKYDFILIERIRWDEKPSETSVIGLFKQWCDNIVNEVRALDELSALKNQGLSKKSFYEAFQHLTPQEKNVISEIQKDLQDLNEFVNTMYIVMKEHKEGHESQIAELNEKIRDLTSSIDKKGKSINIGKMLANFGVNKALDMIIEQFPDGGNLVKEILGNLPQLPS